MTGDEYLLLAIGIHVAKHRLKPEIADLGKARQSSGKVGLAQSVGSQGVYHAAARQQNHLQQAIAVQIAQDRRRGERIAQLDDVRSDCDLPTGCGGNRLGLTVAVLIARRLGHHWRPLGL